MSTKINYKICECVATSVWNYIREPIDTDMYYYSIGAGSAIAWESVRDSVVNDVYNAVKNSIKNYLRDSVRDFTANRMD
jgi:hypothetical protein